VRDGPIVIPETPRERLADRVRHFFHRLKLPRGKAPDDSMEKPCKELVAELLDD
jgi:hypothetical protein